MSDLHAISKVEALADSIIAFTSYCDPGSAQYRYRNPLGLMAFCRHALPFRKCAECVEPKSARIEYDPDTGMRIFRSHIRGYQYAIYDLQIKCEGRSYSKVRRTSSIRELIRSYYLPDATADCSVCFLRKALDDDSITEDTPIEYFVAGTEKGVVKCLTTHAGSAPAAP